MQINTALTTLGVTILLLSLLAVGCKPDANPDNTTTVTTSPPQYKASAFNADSAYAFVQRQVDFGPRVVNSEGHRQTRAWLLEKLKSYGMTVSEQQFTATAYTGTVLNGTNIIARYNPEQTDRILLAAHWDTRHIADSELSTERQEEPILGADDGASGVGVLLEIARQLAANPIPTLGVDIVLFDAEDYGDSRDGQSDTEATWALGAQHFARNLPAGPRPRYGVLLDMVGARGARFPIEAVSAQAAPEVVRKVWSLAQQMGKSDYFVTEQVEAVLDDHYFVNTIARIPMVDIINLPSQSTNRFGDHWHTHNDNMDIIDRRTLGAVGQVVLTLLYREASGTL